MEIKNIVNLLESLIKNPSEGLPEDIFLFVSRITPMINVDLLIKNKKGETLLTWRDDAYYSPGWHIPGGIIRYKEKVSERIRAVARNELGTCVRFKRKPLAINEVIIPERRNRAHFISLLYKCELINPPAQTLKFKKGAPVSGQWAWHRGCPRNIIPVHRMYKNFI